MTWKQRPTSNETLPLLLTGAERSLILEGVTSLPVEFERAIQRTPGDQPVMLPPDDLDELGDHIAAEANHTKDKKAQRKLDALFQKIEHLLDTQSGAQEHKTSAIDDTQTAKLISDQVAQIAEWIAKALVVAEQLGIKKKPVVQFCLAPMQRGVLLLVPRLSEAIKRKLAKKNPSFTVAEVAGMTTALAEALPAGEPHRQLAYLLVAKHLIDCLQEEIAGPAISKVSKGKVPKAKTAAKGVFQFKITLKESNPAIWRRIQVEDCTLDKLHEHIQTAMGWTNSHLHQFVINGKRYGDPALLDEGFDDFECVDSTRTMISEIVPKNVRRFRFTYEYDFGDGWEHDVLFEGCPKPESGAKYPLCLEGERACPPEDVGGIWGFYEFLEALADPKHERHDEFREWSGPFDPEKFDPGKATRAMRKGLPNWRQ